MQVQHCSFDLYVWFSEMSKHVPWLDMNSMQLSLTQHDFSVEQVKGIYFLICLEPLSTKPVSLLGL